MRQKMYSLSTFWHWSIWLLLFHIAVITPSPDSRSKKLVTQNMKYFPERFRPSIDRCSKSGRPVYCTPTMENIIQGRDPRNSMSIPTPAEIEASQTCGENGQIDRYCKRGPSSWSCGLCDATDPENKHPVSFLNDMVDENHTTCWHSGRILDPSIKPTDQKLDLETINPKNVSIEINFKHLYEINFIWIEFCGPIPDAMAIYKSVTYNGDQTKWVPYQYHASDCQAEFGIEPSRIPSMLNPDEVLCSEKSSPVGSPDGSNFVFNVLQNRNKDDSNPVIQHWKTAGAIKIELIRPSLWPSAAGDKKNHNAALIDAFQYSISDIKIGGNCQCNGHADSCTIRDGKPVCNCKHGTEGETCNKCMPFFHDRPWQRGTKENPNECVRCNCNLHARKCKFDPKTFDANKKSGGVCQRCKHNTTGINCQYCVTGYTPDKSKKPTDRRYCKQCSCHPVGSIGPICNQTTGACSCKEGVTGRECSRCAKGYVQSKSLEAPCTKRPNKITPPCQYPRDSNCPYKCPAKCQSHKEQGFTLSTEKFCSMTFVVHAEVKKRETSENYVIYTVDIRKIYRPEKTGGSRNTRNRFIFETGPSRVRPSKKSRNRPSRDRSDRGKSRRKMPRLRTGTAKIWVKKQDDKCGCPKLRPKQSYLILGNQRRIGRSKIIAAGGRTGRNRDLNIGLDKKTVAIKWNDRFDHKLVVAKRRARKLCELPAAT